MTRIVGTPAQQHVQHVADAPPPQAAGPVQFSSSNKSIFRRIADKLGVGGPQRPTPHAKFTVVAPSKKGFFTNNLQGVRDEVFGDKANRQDVSARILLAVKMQRTGSSHRLNTDYTIQTGRGDTLSGFSMSAAPNSAALDVNRPVVLFLSGSNGSAEQYGGDLAKHYAVDHQTNFVALNYRGYGESTDVKPSEASITKDGFEMINHLLQQGFSPDQIIVHGFSMGASVAAHIQARVEEGGYALRGAIYDRPMSSATGAAKSVAEEAGPGLKTDANAQLFAFGTKITTGSLSTRKTLEALQASAPGHQFRTPTFVTYDQGSFGDRSNRMGQAIGLQPISTNSGHMDSASAIQNALSTLPGTMYA